MGCNPCCCWKLKDAAITIGIWSVLYSMVSLGLFTWQSAVLAECRHVTMAQSNLQCEYYCPCVGASTARTSSIVEAIYRPLFRFKIYCIIQLGIFGWQTAAIKYEKDRAANTLLPNYNTYGRYDIPSYYESYWQSPEERYYTGLFVIQILCLITSFFLLFTSLSLIYGVHTWSQFLVWPWFICMASSILTSLAYCIMWWAGDVRDYWLVLTILEAFGIFLNCYCFVVICVFYKRMQIELEYYEGRRAQKYDRFSHQATPRMNEFDDDDFRGDYPYPYRGGPAPYDWPQGEYRYNGGTVSKYPPDPLPSYLQQQQPQPQQQLQQQQQFTQQQPQTYVAPQPPPSQQQQQQQQQPFITQKYDPIIPAATQPQAAAAEPFERPRSSATQSAAPFDDFYDVPRQEHQRSLRHRSERRHCHHHHHRHHHRSASQRRKRHHSGGASTSADPHRHHHHHHHHHLKPNHHNHQRDCDCHHYGRHCRRGAAIASCSSDCSGTESTTTASTSHYANMTTLERRGRLTRTLSRLSDEAEDDGIGVDSDEVGESAADKLAKRQSLKRRKSARKGARNLPTTAQPLAAESIPPSTRSRLAADDDAASSVAADPLAGGITIPQHIVIPPSALIGGADGAGGPNAERKYQINSEITIHYDPRRHRVEQSSRDNASEAGSGLQSLLRNQPTSITSNV